MSLPKRKRRLFFVRDEEWKYTQYPGYWVSNLGRVKNEFRSILKGSVTEHGYLRVTLRVNGKNLYKYVHELVLETFVGERPNVKMECRHLDGDRQNAFLSNLVWGTKSENQQDKKCHGTDNEGERHPLVKLRSIDIESIRIIARRGLASRKDIASCFGISRSHCDAIIRGEYWK